MPAKRLSVKEMLATAKKLPPKEQYVTSFELGPVLDVLYARLESWKDVNKWCADRGYKWSYGGMRNGWKRWKDAQASTQKKAKKAKR